MTTPLRRFATALSAVVAVAATVAVGPGRASAAGPPAHRPPITESVMTRNLYLGADLTPLISPSGDLGSAVISVLSKVEQSNPPARMAAVAEEIDHARPDVVALQEAADWTISLPGTATVSYDFTSLILDRLAALGDRYKVAVTQDNFDSASLPAALPGRFIDRDVILVRTGTKVLATGGGHFADQLTYSTPILGPVTFTRGYVWADMRLGLGVTRFVDTHLEAYDPTVAGRQAAQLVSVLAGSRLPTVLAGDMNSDPAIAGYDAAADTFTAARYIDEWTAARPGAPGYTCCRNADLTGGTLDQRIDHIYGKGLVIPLSAWRTGVNPIGTSEPRWPSDHAGVVVRMLTAGLPFSPSW